MDTAVKDFHIFFFWKLSFKTFYLNVFTIAGIQYSETQGIATGADAFDLDAATAIALRVSISSIHAWCKSKYVCR